MESALQRKKIMVVEEERNTALSIKLALETNNFLVEMFTEPLLALEEFKKNSQDYSLIIIDMKMISMSAFEFMRKTKAKDPDIKVLLITTFEIKPTEFSRVLPTVKIEGLIEKPSLLNKIIPSVNKILGSPLDKI
ncbi:MAG TPA: response regulator [Candidatus Nitrosotalea sp.]|nr:response regulator [Candidatus Nitrosotalea sp.]